MNRITVLLAVSVFCLCNAVAQKSTKETVAYGPVNATIKGKKLPYSPDPLSGYRWEKPLATDELEIYTISPIEVTADIPDNFVAGNNLSSIKVTGDCSLMFDFGQVNAGWLEFESDNLKADIEMSISEFNEPAVFNLGSQHPIKTARPVKYGNTYRLELNHDLYEGVRFGWIHLQKLNQPAEIKNVRLICQIKPTNYEGSFSCSDTILNRMWYTGAYTVKLNLLKDYFGAILMERSDRHSWTGDAHTSQAASMVAFGNYDFVKANLIYTSSQYNGIATYSLYWVLSLIDYYNYTADTSLVLEYLENACDKLDVAYEHYGKNPPLAFCGWDERLGAGFESSNEECQILYQMLSIRAWNEFAEMVEQMEMLPHLVRKYRGYANEKIKALRNDKHWTNRMGLHSAAEAVNAGFTTKKEQTKLWNIAFMDRQQRLSYSPFNQYFIMYALSGMGKFPEALNTAHDCWGGQLAYGGTTFFEVYRPSWNTISSTNDAPPNNQCGYTSLTHPWSAGITKWLSEEILGIKPTTPGFFTCLIKPALSANLTWVKGSVPTPLGKIEASFDMVSGECEVNLPSMVEATVAIPKVGRKIKGIRFHDATWHKIKEDNEFIYYLRPGGNSKITVNYEGELPQVPEENFSYYLQTPVKEDNETQGNWKNKYGTKGYVLCNFEQTGENVQLLPSFVENFSINRAGNLHWTHNTSDVRALQSPTGDRTKGVGALITRDPEVCQQTFTIDIETKKEQRFSVSLYFVDWDNNNRRVAIEAFGLDSKELLCPLHMVRDYEDGKYVTYTFSQPVRLRINHVRGKNAALSGIFFD